MRATALEKGISVIEKTKDWNGDIYVRWADVEAIILQTRSSYAEARMNEAVASLENLWRKIQNQLKVKI